MPKQFSLGQMQNQLAAARTEAEEVRTEIKELRSEFNERLNVLERRLLALVGVTPPPAPPKTTPEEQAPLWQWIKTVLLNSNEPLTAKIIAQLVREAGYQTTSPTEKAFCDVVQQCLASNQKHFRRVKGRLKKPSRWEFYEEERTV